MAIVAFLQLKGQMEPRSDSLPALWALMELHLQEDNYLVSFIMGKRQTGIIWGSKTATIYNSY